MADETQDVEIPFGDNQGETATLLLAAAEDLEYEPGVVRTSGDGYFTVPADVAKKAGVKVSKESDETPRESPEAPSQRGTAKKAAAKKAPAKKATKAAK